MRREPDGGAPALSPSTSLRARRAERLSLGEVAPARRWHSVAFHSTHRGREKNGRLKRTVSIDKSEEASNLSVVRNQRVKHYGARADSPRTGDWRDQKYGSALGRLSLKHRITLSQLTAGHVFSGAAEKRRRALEAPRPRPRVPGAFGTRMSSLSEADQARKARIALLVWDKIVDVIHEVGRAKGIPGAEIMDALESVCIHDHDVRNLTVLKIGLDRIAILSQEGS